MGGIFEMGVWENKMSRTALTKPKAIYFNGMILQQDSHPIRWRINERPENFVLNARKL